MAKAGKIPQSYQNDFCPSYIKRTSDIRPRRRYYLIVCEGKKTEPNYFEAIQRILPRNMLQLTIRGTGRNTLSLVAYTQNMVAERCRAGEPPYNNVWVVFDKDSFRNDLFDNAIAAINSNSNSKVKWQAAWSNEAFELWYILHFSAQTGGGLSRNAYKKKLTLAMGRPYKKNSPDMFDLLKPHIKDAITRAETSLNLQRGKPFHAQNPATTVHLLVQELLQYIPNVI